MPSTAPRSSCSRPKSRRCCAGRSRTRRGRGARSPASPRPGLRLLAGLPPCQQALTEEDTESWRTPPWQSSTWSPYPRALLRPRRSATASTSPATPSGSATRATGSPSTTSTLASRAPRPRWCSRSPRQPRPPSGSARGPFSSATAPRCPRSRSSDSSTRSTPPGSTSDSAVRGAGRRTRHPSPPPPWLDLGLGRSGGRPPNQAPEPALAVSAPAVLGRQAPNGLRIPPRFSPGQLLKSPRLALQRKLLQLPNAEPQDYGDQIDDILSLLRGTYRSADGIEAHAIPGEGAQLQVWILGSSGGESAQVAGRNGLRFAANYHVSPATVLEAVDGYRAAFQPSAELARPYISVSADVVVAGDEATARELASGYGLWVHSIRAGEGAIQFPAPEQARARAWSAEQQALVADRVDTQFVGPPWQVAGQLEQLRDATGADELIITTITHNHADRVRSYQLLAEEWSRR